MQEAGALVPPDRKLFSLNGSEAQETSEAHPVFSDPEKLKVYDALDPE